MALPNGTTPTVDGIWFRPVLVTPDDSTPAVIGQNAIPAGAKVVSVGTVTNNTSDFILLPALSTVPRGHSMLILCLAGGAFKMNAQTGEKINNVTAGVGVASYQCTDTNIIEVVKMSTTAGWMAHEWTNLGAVVAAVVPA